MRDRIALFVLATCLAATMSCGSGELPVTGRVLVDGAPMESGTLHLDPVGGNAGKGAGGLVEAGTIQLPPGHGLLPGKYRVTATAFKKTGKTINDYQRGSVEEMIQLSLKDSPHEIEITSENSSALVVEFTSKSRR